MMQNNKEIIIFDATNLEHQKIAYQFTFNNNPDWIKEKLQLNKLGNYEIGEQADLTDFAYYLKLDNSHLNPEEKSYYFLVDGKPVAKATTRPTVYGLELFVYTNPQERRKNYGESFVKMLITTIIKEKTKLIMKLAEFDRPSQEFAKKCGFSYVSDNIWLWKEGEEDA